MAIQPPLDPLVETLLGQNTKDQYHSSPTQWPNRTISDTLYLPKSSEANLPPILIEVQHTVDDDFILRLMDYSISVYRQFKNVHPIVVTFNISSMKYEVSKKILRNRNQPFLNKYSCSPWAEACYFVNDASLSSSLTQPLHPFVALAHFFIYQHQSLLASPFREDLTIQLLYSIAARVFEEQIVANENKMKDIIKVCDNAVDTISSAIASLKIEIQDESKWSATRSILENGMVVPKTYKQKYEELLDEPSTTATTSIINAATSTNTTASNTAPAPSDASTSTGNATKTNWEFVEEYLAGLAEDEPIPWELIYKDGDAARLFKSYKDWFSMKSSYYRWERANRR